MEVSSISKALILLVLLLATFTTLTLAQSNRGGGGGTRIGFYRSTCPSVESIVQSAVQSAVRANPTIGPGLLRMFFHDCFVNGCDASILINGPSTEKTAGPNSLLRGFEVIDAAKSQLETGRPGVVSCADILSLAARDSVVLGDTVVVRRDGLVSRASDTANLPAFNDPISVQVRKFADKGLNIKDLVTLVALCPNGRDRSIRVALDTGSVNRFDNSFYANIRNGLGVIESDAKLWSDPTTQRFVQRFLGFRGLLGLRFDVEFGSSMVKMGNVEVKTGTQGEIRRVCMATS
ncbi:hypothetical protein L1987_49121 [Smallanthus sonchifolius]|uniref:Uncharacterized protein n=1 Tax=Smallanthus sonchifolius TaxID=185202 RepID=A0ACB9FTW0_9ASTR|nr:hypothetical protein L1987_49121 [Smallanthus sonchifolius]